MKNRNIIIILAAAFAIIVVLASFAAFFLGRGFFLDRIKIFLTEKIESSLQKGVRIERLRYSPLKGIRLDGVSLYEDTFYKKKIFYVSRLYIKFSLIEFIARKTFSPTIAIDNLKLEKALVNGYLGFSAKLLKKSASPKDVSVTQNIWFRDLSVKSDFFSIRDVNGSLRIGPQLIKTSDVSFLLNEEPCKLAVEITNPKKELSANIDIVSPKLNFSSCVKKDGEIYKISSVKGNFMNSSFELMGELSFVGEKNGQTPLLSFYGKADLDIGDIGYFAPQKIKSRLAALEPEGRLTNSIYFKGNPKDIKSWEAGVKSGAEFLKIKGFKFDRFQMDTRIKDGSLSVPLASAYPYNGVVASSARIDFTDEFSPYAVSCKLNNIDIGALLQNTGLRDKNIKGLLFSEFVLKGDAVNIESMEGSGNIFIKDANLGPMPILTPLLGNIYGYLQSVFPELRKVDITRASTDFYVAKRKLSTNNLVLRGDMVSVHAKGFIDFDSNLNFEVENRFVEPEKRDTENWQTNLQSVIVQFGKIMSNARLTGTLQKPQWKFQYVGGLEEVFKGKVGQILKGIFAE